MRKDAPGYMAFSPGYNGYYNVYKGAVIDRMLDQVYPQCFDPVIRACLIDVPIPVARGHVQGTWNAEIETLHRKCFSLSCTEVGLTGSVTEGTAFPYFSSNANRIAYFDGTSTAVSWWLRSPHSSGNLSSAYTVYTDGAQDYNYVYYADYCPRPALALSSEILVSNTASSDGCYVVEDAVVAGEQYQKVNGVWRRMV